MTTATAGQLNGTAQLGTNQFRWEVWDGQPLGKYVAIDTETTLIQNHQIPQLCMLSISDGECHYVAPPQLAHHLVMATTDSQLIFHNAGFDFWVLDRHLRGKESRNWLWSAVDQQRIHDTMLLSGLVQMAENDSLPILSLSDAAQQWLGYSLDKDTYRCRYAETIGAAWDQLDPGFFQYAAGDAITTWHLYARLTRAADSITRQHSLCRTYGFLTEAIQVKAAICLALINRRGLHVDLHRAAELRGEIDNDISGAVEQLETINAELWHRYKKTGQRKVGSNHLPKLNQTKLRQLLDEIRTQHQLQIPSTPTGKLTTSVNKCWCQYRDVSPLVDAYCNYNELTKLRQFFAGLDSETIHPSYSTMVRTGRTACSGPNIQQMPVNSPIRQAITARPGNLLFIIDYNSLELRTLAAVCYQRFGFSKLRDVLIDGIDPHSYCAAMFAGVSLEQFNQLPDKKQLRQRAKVFNFGLPAGFGAPALCDHAKFAYGVHLELSDAKQFIHRWTHEVFPEMRQYLKQDGPHRNCNEPAWTTTGRLRGAVPFTAARNTPFQGLASDGCKLAMWELTKAGYAVVAFIHDEFVIELAWHDDWDAAAADINRICGEAMQPLVPGIPVPCEYALAERWDKRAEAQYGEDGRLQIWQPAQETAVITQ